MTPPSLSDILRATADRYGVSVEDMRGASRRRAIVYPRWTAFYLARLLTRRSSLDIGYSYDKDHSSILFGARRFQALMATDEKLRDNALTIIFWLSRGRYEAKAHAAARAIADGLVIFGIYRFQFGRKVLSAVRAPKPSHPHMHLIRALDAPVPDSLARAERWSGVQRPQAS